MSSLIDMLKDLGRDAALEGEFEKDPDTVMDRYELGGEERKALKAEDVESVKRLTGLSDVHLTNGTIKSYD